MQNLTWPDSNGVGRLKGICAVVRLAHSRWKPCKMKSAQRSRDREHRKLHVPLVNRAAALDPRCDRPPPTNVVVMGPPGCGKTTLIRSLVKKYTRQNLRDVLGPCTVVSGKLVALYIYVKVVFSQADFAFVSTQESTSHVFRMPGQSKCDDRPR